MLEEIYKETKEKMGKTKELLAHELLKIRTGRASPAILEGIKVEYYGTEIPLRQIASISAPEPRLLVIQPWDKNALPDIEKGIYKAGLGLTPQNDGNVIRIAIPPLTQERREELVKLCAKITEDSKIAIRNIRRDAKEKIKRLEKDKKISEDDARNGEKKIQEYTDDYIETLDGLLEKKRKEILED